MDNLLHLRSLSIDYSDGEAEEPEDYPQVEDKLAKAKEVLATTLRTYDRPAVLWTGGKDSTLVLYLIRELLDSDEADEFTEPEVVFIDHGQHFSDVMDFVVRWGENWDFDVEIAWNDDDVLYQNPGTDVAISELNERNAYEVRVRLDYEEDTFPLLLDTLVGNHLLKTIALNDAIEWHEFDAVITGVRWDEQETRGEETFFSPRHESEKFPPHDRVHPILAFTESDVWDATWTVVVPETVKGFPVNTLFPKSHSKDDLWGYDYTELPVSKRYFTGYRSLGSETSTTKSGDDPAWYQNLNDGDERAGRGQDKEDLMERLRDLGYM